MPVRTQVGYGTGLIRLQSDHQEKRPGIIPNNYLILENKVDNRLIMESYLS